MKSSVKVFIFTVIGLLIIEGIGLAVVDWWPLIPILGSGGGGKDTPVVIVGGCIRPETAETDNTGVKRVKRGSHYSLAAKATKYGSPKGIDHIELADFDSGAGSAPNLSRPAPPPGPSTVTYDNTGGWAVTYSDTNPDSTKHPNALKICSDAQCSASAMSPQGNQNPQICKGTFNPDGPVHIFADDRARWEELESGDEIVELRFHDTDPRCDGPKGRMESSCD
jgi:hypothetical protein